MCHSTLLGILLGVFATKLFWRWRAYRHGHGCAGGHCGPSGAARWARRCGFGPFNRWAGSGAGFGPGPGQAAGRSLDEFLHHLDLNQRQQEESAPVFALLRERLGSSGARVEGVLAALAADSFDRARVESIVADVAPAERQKLVEGLEHVHTILIPEQRQYLRGQLFTI